jgi:hypothetical protein
MLHRKSHVLAIALSAVVVGIAVGQTPPVEPPKPVETKPAEPKPVEPQPSDAKPADVKPAEVKPTDAALPAKEPTLDELLGITPTAPKVEPPTGVPTTDPATKPPATPDRVDLTRKLNDEGEQDDFSRAVTLMGDAAKRLDEGKDPGLQTQRVQEDVLKALDKMISDAQKNKQQQKSKQKQQQQQPQPSPSQSQKQQKAQQQAAQPSAQPGMPQVPREDGPGKTRAGNTAAWGDLPARVREALVEGLNDRFSARYRQKTEEYYRRLAEDKSGGNR